MRRLLSTWFSLSCAMSVVLLGGAPARALTYDWNPPTTGSTAWSNGVNWGGTAPSDSLTADQARFSQATYNFQPDVGAGTNINKVSIGGTSAALTISGTQLGIGDGGIDMAANAAVATANAAVLLGADQTWTVSSTNGFSALGGLRWTDDRRLTFSSAASKITIRGALAGAGMKLTLAGSGTNIAFGDGTGVVSGTTGGVVVDGPTVIFGGNAGGASSTYTGGTTLKSGQIAIANTGSNPAAPPGPVTSSPIGLGDLTLSGGTIRASGATRQLLNNTLVTGAGNFTVTFGLATGGNDLSFVGNNTIGGPGTTPTLVNLGNATKFISSTTATNTIAGDFNVQINGNNLLQLLGPDDNSGKLILTNTSHTIRVTGTGSGGNAYFSIYTPGVFSAANPGDSLTISSDFVNSSSSLPGAAGVEVGRLRGGTGTNDPKVIVTSPSGNAGFVFRSGSVTTLGGVTLTSGFLVIGSNQTITGGAIERGPIGIGPLSIANGNFRTDGTARTLSNSTTLSGTIALGALSGSNTLTFDPTALTIPNTFTIDGPTALTTYTDTSITATVAAGPNTPSLTVKGPGVLTLTNKSATVASALGNLTVGDGLLSGSLSGTVIANSSTLNGTNPAQTALGAGDVLINYGGTVTVQAANATAALTLTNNITVKSGGTLSLYRPGAFSGTVIFESLATVTQSSGNSGGVTMDATKVSLPSSGAMFFAGANDFAVTGAYPSLSGTLAIGGTNTATLTTSAVTTLSTTAGQARTLAVNKLGTTSFSGIQLNGDLTLAGTGGLATATGTSLGNITEDAASARSITLVAAPLSVYSVNATTNGWTGGTTLRGGVLNVNLAAGGGTGRQVGASGVVLNGGALRFSGAATVATSATDSISVGAAAGSAIEAVGSGNGNAPTVTIGANITPLAGGASLALRYGSAGGDATTQATLVIAGDNSASGSDFNSGFTLGVAPNMQNRGSVMFAGPNALGGAANAISVPAGVVFGFTSAFGAVTPAHLAKFTTTADSILALNNFASVDLSATGLNRDLRLGNSAAVNITAGAVTPFADTYRFVPGPGNLQISVDNVLTGSRNLDISAGATAPGATASVLGQLTIVNPQDYTGSTSISGVIGNALAGGAVQGAGATLLNLQANLSAAGPVALNRGAVVSVGSLNGKCSGTSGVTVLGGATLYDGSGTAANNDNNPDRINPNAALTLGGADGGGTFAMSFGTVSFSQTLASLAVAAGSSTLTTRNTAAGSLALTWAGTPGGGGYTRAAGGLLNVVPAAGFYPNFPNAPTAAGGSSVAGTADPILIGATLNRNDFVAARVGGLVVPGYTLQIDLGRWGLPGNSENIRNSGLSLTGTANTGTINSLRLTSGGGLGTMVTIGSNNTLTIASGMILAYNDRSADGGATFNLTGGTLTSSNGADLIFVVNNQSGNRATTVNVTSVIPSGAGAVTKAGDGTLTLNNAASAFSGLYALAGTTNVNTQVALGTTGINVLGGQVNLGGTDQTYGPTVPVAVGAVGGSLLPADDKTITLQGPVTLNGALAVYAGNGGGNGNLVLGGNIIGPGAIGIDAGGSSGKKSIFTFSGNNSGWSGGIGVFGGGGGGGVAHVRFDSPTASGTGPIARSGRYYYTSALSTTVPNLWLPGGNTILTVWNTGPGLASSGGTAVTELTGDFLDTGGLIVQGYATADNQISELVLSGKVQVGGIPASYSFGDGTLARSFVNGQGGITLGVTNRQGTATVAANLAIDLPGGATANDGALGFVRFNGPQSFIPGAVGPGYLAAMRKAGTDQGGRFGYLLTGAAGGTTYQLPEGKSFLIGSLGSGTQVGGTFGATGSASNTATLVGSTINVHANDATSAQSLNLLARNAGDTLVLGAAGSPVVVTPTYGDSGSSTAITLLSARNGAGAATSLNKIGAGTVVMQNVAFNHVGGTTNDARGTFTLNVNGGTLLYNQDDTALAGFAAVNVNSGGVLAAAPGSSLKAGSVTLQGGAGIASEATAPGDPAGLTVNSNLTWNGTVTKTGSGTYNLAYNGSAANVTVAAGAKLVINTGGVNVGGTTDPFTQTGGTARSMDVENNGSLSIAAISVAVGNLSGTGGALAGTTTLQGGAGLTANYIFQDTLVLQGTGATVTIRASSASDAGDMPALGGGLNQVPEPGTLALLGIAALGLLLHACRRRQTGVY